MNFKKSILLSFSLSSVLMSHSIFGMEKADTDYRPQEASDLPRENISKRRPSKKPENIDLTDKISLNANQCSLLSKGSVLRNAGRNLSMTDPIMKLNKLCRRYPYTIVLPTIEAYFAYCTKKNDKGLVVGVVKSPACAELSYLGNSMVLYMYLKGSQKIFTPKGFIENPKMNPLDKNFIGLWKHFLNVVNNKRQLKRGDEKLLFEKGDSFENQLKAVMDRDPNSRGAYDSFNEQTAKRQVKHVRKVAKRTKVENAIKLFRSLSPEEKRIFMETIEGG